MVVESTSRGLIFQRATRARDRLSAGKFASRHLVDTQFTPKYFGGKTHREQAEQAAQNISNTHGDIMDFSLLLSLLAIYPLPEPLPPLTDLRPFVRGDCAGDSFLWAAYHREWCQRRRDESGAGTDRRFAWHRRVEEALCTEHVWFILFQAHNPKSSDEGRRERLDELRSLIGPHDYYRGIMPTPYPVWRIPVQPDAFPRPTPAGD